MLIRKLEIPPYSDVASALRLTVDKLNQILEVLPDVNRIASDIRELQANAGINPTGVRAPNANITIIKKPKLEKTDASTKEK